MILHNLILHTYNILCNTENIGFTYNYVKNP